MERKGWASVKLSPNERGMVAVPLRCTQPIFVHGMEVIPQIRCDESLECAD